MKQTLQQKITTDKRVEDLSHDDDGWWCYLRYGLHNGDHGNHLIHEDSLTAVRKQLAGIKPATHTCGCDECTKALTSIQSV